MELFFKKIMLVLSITITLFSTTGCWNRRELSELGMVGAVAIDAQETGVKLTYEIVTPMRYETSVDETPSSYFQSQGESIFDANRNSTLKFSKKLFWPHLNVIYFNEKAAQIGLLQYLDYFSRNHEARRYVNLVITKGKPAYEIIGVSGARSEVPSNYVEIQLENLDANGKGVSVKIMDFLKIYYDEGIEPIVSVVEIVKRNEDELKAPIESGEFMVSCEGVAVFREDLLVGFLDGLQTRGYNFATDQIKSAIIVSKASDSGGINSVEVIKASGSIDIQIVDGQYLGSVEIEINGMLNEATGLEDVSKPEVIAKIEDSTSDKVKLEIEESIKKVQSFKSDIFGFGQALHRKYPQEWKIIKKDWNDIFSAIKIKVTVKTNIQKIGVANEQVTLKE